MERTLSAPRVRRRPAIFKPLSVRAVGKSALPCRQQHRQTDGFG
jgi:hypothetical protein